MDKDSEIAQLKQQLEQLQKENEKLKQQQQAFEHSITKNRHSDEFWEKVEKACKYDPDYIKLLIKNKTIKMDDTDKYGRTLLILCAMSGSYELTQLCLNLGADIAHETDLGRTALHESELFADVKQLLLFSELNANIGNRIKDTAYIINKQTGFIQNIQTQLNKYDETTKQFFKDTLSDLMINIIQQRLSFSDDLLNLCWSFEADPLSSKLWITMENICNDIIKSGNKRDWHYMKTYIIPSTLWYRTTEEKDEEKYDIWHKAVTSRSMSLNDINIDFQSYLFHRLFKLVDIQSKTELELLEKNLNIVANTDKSSWNILIKYDIERDYEYDFVRQDLIPNALLPKYTFQSLSEQSSSSAVFNSHRFYDYNQYLPELILLANIVDDEFQKSIQGIFNIDKHSNIGYIGDEKDNVHMVKYVRGPVKLMERSRSKAEHHYIHQSYPTSACILDVNRCALVFNDIKGLLFSLNMFRNKVKYYQSGNIIGIVRDKNKFKDYINQVQYADVKLNVLIKGKQNNIIGEVQFIPQTMLDFRNVAHNLYQIERQKEYVDNSVSLILPTLLDPLKQLWVSANMDDVKGLSNLMVINNKTEDDIMAYGVYRESILHTICTKGNEKAFVFLQSIINEDLFLKCLLLSNNKNTTSIEYAVQNSHLSIIKKIYGIDKVKDLYKNDKKLMFRLLIWLFGFCHNDNIIDYLLFKLEIYKEKMVDFINYKYVENEEESKVSDGAHQYGNYRILCYTVYMNDLRILQKLVSIIGENVFVEQVLISDHMNINALEYAIKMSKSDVIKYIMSFDEIKQKCLENDNVLWRIICSINDKYNKSVAVYLLRVLNLDSTKLKKLQSLKYTEDDETKYHSTATKYETYSISDEMVSRLLTAFN